MTSLTRGTNAISQIGSRMLGIGKQLFFRGLISVGAFILVACCPLSGASAQSQWMEDERLQSLVEIPAKEITLSELCSLLRDQVTVETYVDRRFADYKIALFIEGKVPLKTAMSLAETVTGLKWRMVDDLFLLTKSVTGEAVTAWYERYAEAQKAHEAGVLEKRTREWLASTMPFPPRFDPPWMLSPLQGEEMAFQQALSIFAMTPAQMVWLDHALRVYGFQTGEDETPIDRLMRESTLVPVALNVGLVIRSGGKEYLIEMPLSEATRQTEEKKSEPPSVPPDTAAPKSSEQPEEPTKTTNLTGEPKGIWVSGGDYDKLPSLIRKAKTAGFTDVFLPVLRLGYTLYPSSRIPQEPAYRGKDPLGDAVRTADNLGIRIHAVLHATLWGDETHPVVPPASSPLIQDRNLLGRTFSEQEKWQRTELARLGDEVASQNIANDKRVYLCPASSQVSRLLRQIVDELATRYKIAGVCLDGLDYPRNTPFKLAGADLTPPFGYTIEVRKEMIRANQVDPLDVNSQSAKTAQDMELVRVWEQFRRGRLTGLITDIAGAFRSRNAKGVCSVVVDLDSPDQSPVHWAKIRNVDALIPELEITKPTEDTPAGYSQEDLDVVSSLQKSVGKNCTVIPAITGLDKESISNQTAAVNSIALRFKDVGLKALIISGDTDTLILALDSIKP